MTDVASLVLAVDSTQVKAGAASLDGLTAAGARAEAASIGLGGGVKSAGVAAAAMAAQAQASSRAAMGMAAGFNASAGAARLNTIAMRETLVVARELSRGNFTRIPGSLSLLFANTSGGLSGFASSLLTTLGIIKQVQNAELAEEATNAAAAASAIQGAAERAAANIAAADTELALAQASVRVAEGSVAEAAAQARLAAAHEAVAAAAGEAAIAEDALAVAAGRAAEAGKASAAATRTTLGTVGAALAGVAIAAGVVVVGFKVMQEQVRNDHTLDDYANSLGLSKKEMKELRQEVGGFTSKEMRDLETRTKAFGLTWGDVWHGLNKAASDALDLSAGWQSFKSGTADAFKSGLAFAESAAAHMYGLWVGAYRTIVEQWKALPSAFSAAFVSAVNVGIDALNGLVQRGVDLLNGFIDQANKLPFVNVGHAAVDQIQHIAADAGKKAGKSFGENVAEATAEATKQIAKNVDTIWTDIIGAAEKRIKDAADSIIEDRNAKKPKKANDHGLAEALAELDAQIQGQNRLAAAYQVSDAAAIKAEALQKAEEQAIRHKGEVGIFYEKELALAVATRAAEGGKIIADLRYEADSRAAVNGQIASGLIPASQANQALQLETVLRPLTAAASVAEGKAKADLIDIIRNLTTANADNNAEIARTAALQQIASNDDSTAKLQKEIDLISASNRARAVGLAILEAEQKIKNEQTPVDQQKTLIASYVAQANATVTLAEKQNAYNASLSYAADLLSLINERAQQAGQALSDAFGSVGAGIGQAITALTNYAAVQAKADQEHAAAIKAAGDNAAALSQAETLYATQSANNQLAAIGGVLGGLKALFKEHSAGYKAMEAAEKAFAIIQAINTIKNVAAGAAKMFATLGPFAFPAVAAMIAVMAGLGFSGGSSTQKAPDIPTSGEGTVLGDTSAKSQSISNSLDLMAKNSTKGLDYSSAMVTSLRKIESGIGNLASAIARQLQLSGGAFDGATLGLGTTSSRSFNLLTGAIGLIGGIFGGLLGGILGGKKTVTKSLFDQGIQFNPATIQQIITQGISGATYNVIQTITKKSGFLGIGGSTKTSYSTVTGSLDSDISTQTNLIIADLYKSVVSAAKVLGLDVADALKTFQVQIGQISFKDLKGDQITQALQAVFSKIGDQMAGFAVAGLAQFQKAGEGLYETLMRLAKDYLTVDAALKSIGLTFGSVGVASVAARESLIDLMGGLDQFVSQINFYYDHFLTTAEQTTFLQSQIDATFSSLGIAEPATIDAFKALVSSLDLTTTAGQTTFAALMAIAPAFYQVQTAAQQAAAAAAAAAAAIAKQKTQLQIQLLQAEGKATEALALQRQMELAALDSSLRGLQQQVYAAQDLAKAKDNLLTAYKSESQALQSTVDKFTGFAKSLKDFRDSLFAADDAQQSYNQALAKLIKVGSLAATGDETALGDIQDTAKNFLSIATDNAGSLADVERARALVARYLNQAIGGAEGQASIAQQQLDQMTAQVSKLVDINNSVLTVAQAIQQLTALLHPGTTTTATVTVVPHPVTVTSTPVLTSGSPQRQEQIQQSLDSISAAVTQTAISANRTARILDRSDRGGALAVYTDSDSPLLVSGATTTTTTTDAAVGATLP